MLYKEDLDSLPCGNPFCDHTAHDGPMVLKQRCHPGKGTTATYKDGQIEITCRICKQLVAVVAIARKLVLKDALVTCRATGTPDGETVNFTLAGIDLEMDTEQFLRIMEYLETFRESYIMHRARLKQDGPEAG